MYMTRHHVIPSATGSPPAARLPGLRALLVALTSLALLAAACGQPSQDPQPGQVFVRLRITGGIAARDVTTTITGDGVVQVTGAPPKTLSGGAAGAVELSNALVAAGIYGAQTGSYMPANTCCDRQTYELTLTRGGKTYSFVTMDSTESAPAQLMTAIGLVQQYANAAK